MTGIWCNKWLVCSEPLLFWPRKTRFSVTAVSSSRSPKEKQEKGFESCARCHSSTQLYPNATHLFVWENMTMFIWHSIRYHSFSTTCELIFYWFWQIRSVLPSEQWMAPSVLADIVVWVSESGLGWWITLLMILAWEWACLKRQTFGESVWVSYNVMDWWSCV